MTAASLAVNLKRSVRLKCEAVLGFCLLLFEAFPGFYDASLK